MHGCIWMTFSIFLKTSIYWAVKVCLLLWPSIQLSNNTKIKTIDWLFLSMGKVSIIIFLETSFLFLFPSNSFTSTALIKVLSSLLFRTRPFWGYSSYLQNEVSVGWTEISQVNQYGTSLITNSVNIIQCYKQLFLSSVCVLLRELLSSRPTIKTILEEQKGGKYQVWLTTACLRFNLIWSLLRNG